MIAKKNRQHRRTRQRARTFVNYVFGGTGRRLDRSRDCEPIHIGGVPPDVFSLLDRHSTSSDPITTFDVGFSEDVPIRQLVEITRFIKDALCAGLDRREVAWIAGAHRKFDPVRGWSTDVHIALSNHLIGSGSRHQPYFSQTDRKYLRAITELVNHLWHLSSPSDPARTRPVRISFARGDSKALRRQKRALAQTFRGHGEITPERFWSICQHLPWKSMTREGRTVRLETDHGTIRAKVLESERRKNCAARPTLSECWREFFWGFLHRSARNRRLQKRRGKRVTAAIAVPEKRAEPSRVITFSDLPLRIRWAYGAHRRAPHIRNAIRRDLTFRTPERSHRTSIRAAERVRNAIKAGLLEPEASPRERPAGHEGRNESPLPLAFAAC